MAFSDYKNLTILKEKHPQIVVNSENFIPDLQLKEVDIWLQKDISISLQTYRSNEFYACEALVSPILRYVWQNSYLTVMNMWTHQAIKYDEDLSGVPDFMFTHLDKKQYEIMSYPIITSVEAKAENFVEGWSQCIAQMLACQKLNTKTNVVIFGIVTTGKQWEFGKLEGNIVIKNIYGCGIDNLPKLITILDYLLSEAKKQL
jgi:type IV secretory pathway VirB2 component (pilin)